ncbi:MAG: transglutaminase-like domain-containing protein [Oscillospiraceae bacterium]|nr:transglutaminase-like domain-containing protein [Oscillospiraceae bacterium]
MRYTGKKEQLRKAKEKGMSKRIKNLIKGMALCAIMAIPLAHIGAIGITTIIEAVDTYVKPVVEKTENMENIEILNKNSLRNMDNLRPIHDAYVQEYEKYLENLERIKEKGWDKIGEENKYNPFYVRSVDKIIIFFDKKRNEKYIDSVRKNENRALLYENDYIKKMDSKLGDTKPRVQIGLRSIASLSLEEIEKLEQKYIIDSVSINRAYIGDNLAESDINTIYNLDTYKKLINYMQEQFLDLKNNKNMPEMEKFIIAVGRIIQNNTYDDEATKLDIKNPRAIESRRMDGALRKKIICAGYSDLFANVMKYLGIETKQIYGFEGEQNEKLRMNHMWNQVRLLDPKMGEYKWYNVDITFLQGNLENKNLTYYNALLYYSDKEAKNIQELKNSKAEYPFLLNSDEAFSKINHKVHVPIVGLAEKCDEGYNVVKVFEAMEKAKTYEIERQKKLHNQDNLQETNSAKQNSSKSNDEQER